MDAVAVPASFAELAGRLLLATLFFVLRRSRGAASAGEALAPLSPAEQQRLDELVKPKRTQRGA